MKPLTPTFNQLMARYDCAPRKIKSLKDPAVIAAINEPNNMGAISIYQDAIFKPDLIAAVKKNGFFWNLHPAILPQDQGLYLAFWSLLEGRTRHGYTLHEIDEGIDTGKRIALHESVLNPRKCVLESYLDSVKNGSKLVQDALSAYLKTGKIEFMPASDKKSAYHSFPTEDDISEAWDKDVRLWGTPEEMLGIYTKIFGEDEFLSTSIRSAIAKIENIEVPHFEFGLNTVYKTQNRHLEMVRKGPF
jgi:methionyl-tRNA formyltransferase